MKRLLAAIALLLSFHAQAQNNLLGCIDRDMRVQSEELKQSFISKGLSVFKDAMLNMEPETPVPVIMPMVKGKVYQLIFIANKNASRVSLQIMDGNHKSIINKENKKGNGNYITYSFIPDKTDDYIIVVQQRFRGRSSCGSLTLLEDAPKDKPAGK
ncbi:MAG: hypothetical protein JNL72_05465 [Flavipsychrobacter sp.]|nr:hypothetical protein [Flavipsychrobacter sp.]